MRCLFFLLLALTTSLSAFAALPPITGTLAICDSATTTLSNATSGGTWSSSDISVLTVGAVSGTVTGVSAGIAVVTYTHGADMAFATMTINARPAAITGPAGVCTGETITLSSATSGGTWLSEAGTIATAGSSSGIVSGWSVGTPAITYTTPNTCYRTKRILVRSMPFLSSDSVTCVGGFVAQFGTSDGTAVYSSSNPAVLPIPSFTAIAVGTATISFGSTISLVGCYATRVVTVNPALPPNSGTSLICAGSAATFTNSTPGGNWGSGNVAIATAGTGTGLVTGIAGGTAAITYAVNAGCRSVSVVTVNAAGALSGAGSFCVSTTSTLATSGGPGGTWSSSAPGIATVGTGGIVAGVAAGTSTISYSTTCGVSTTVVTVNASCTTAPVPGITAASSSIVCSGTPFTLSLPSYTYMCGHALQWQYSSDGTSWSNFTGATSTTYTYSPTASYYYRCRITCPAGSLVAFSTPVYVSVRFTIGSYSTISAPDTACAATHFYITACGVSSSLSVVTYFGDGTTTTTAMSGTPTSSAHIYHSYTLPGNYSIKQVLYNGTTAVDTVTYSYNYLFCRTLPIKFYRDNNGNCIFDGGDTENFTAVQTRIDSNGVPVDTITATSGFYYKAYGPPGTVYAFRPAISPAMAVSCPVSGIVYDTISAYTNTYVAKSVALTCGTAPAFDLNVDATTLAGRHTQRLKIAVSNVNCTPENAILTVAINPKYGFYPGMYPCSATFPPPTSVSPTAITWNLGAVANNDVRTVTLYLERPGGPPTWLIPGDTVKTIISVSPTTGDANPVNNVVIRNDTVKSSYDPNDITVVPEGLILPCTRLKYQVRFENTGNDTAHNIYVLDTLPANLDPASIEVAMATSPMYVSMMPSGGYNIAKFDFPNIMLPDTSHHGLSDGMFTFYIKAKNILPDGTLIQNRVGIYFDDNPPIMTNTATNIIGMAPITGPASVCVGSTENLQNATVGGSWNSSMPSVASVSSIGDIVGLATGTSTISYTVSNSCTSRTATHSLNVQAVATPALTIAATPGDTVCIHNTVTLTATPTYGGASPMYKWFVNGALAAYSGTYSYMPAMGDILYCRLISDYACRLADSANSSSIVMITDSAYTPVVDITSSPGLSIAPGEVLTLHAVVDGAGPLPLYQWYVNATAVAGATTATYTSSTFAHADSVTCMVTGTGACEIESYKSVIVSVSPVHITSLAIPRFSIFPNPNKGSFTVVAELANEQSGNLVIEITNVVGQTILTQYVSSNSMNFSQHVTLPDNAANGVYFMNLKWGAATEKVRLILDR